MKKSIFCMALISLLMGLFAGCSNTTVTRETMEPTESVESVLQVPYSAVSTIEKATKQVLILSSSPRKGGNTDLLCDAFARGAEEVGGHVEKISLTDYRILPLSGAMADRNVDSSAVVADDAEQIIRKMVEADIIVLATPVYFMNINGQLKTLIDRVYGHEKELKNKEFYYMVACADDKAATARCGLNGLRGFVVCLPNPTERGSVTAIGHWHKGSVAGSRYEDEAYQLGKSI